MPGCPPVAVVPLVSGHAVCADIFEKAQTLDGCWPRLGRSCAVEALGAGPVAPSFGLVRRSSGRASPFTQRCSSGGTPLTARVSGLPGQRAQRFER